MGRKNIVVDIMEKKLSSYGFTYEGYEDLRWTFRRKENERWQEVVVQKSAWAKEYTLEIRTEVKPAALRIPDFVNDDKYTYDWLEYGDKEEQKKVLEELGDIIIKYGLDVLEYDAKKLVSVLKRKGISVEHENSYNDFVIRRPKIVMYVWSFLAAAGIVIIGCSLSSEDRELALYGGMLGGALTLVSFCSAAGAWYSKTVVRNKKICQHALLRIKKELLFEQVQYIIMTVENQIQYANIYSNNKKIMIKTQKYHEIENGE